MSIHRPFHFPLCPRILEQDASLETIMLLILPVSTSLCLFPSQDPQPLTFSQSPSWIHSLGQRLVFWWPDPLPIFKTGVKLIGQF